MKPISALPCLSVFSKAALPFLLSLLLTTGIQAQWSSTGGNIGSAGPDSYSSLAVNSATNELWVAVTGDNTYQVFRFDGSAWVQAGGNIGHSGMEGKMSLAFNPATDKAYIAFANSWENTYQVWMFDAGSWAQIGGNINFTGPNGSVSLVFHPVTNEPYLGCQDAADNAFSVVKFNGTSWEQVGDDIGFAGNGAGISLHFNPSTNDPYVGFPNAAVNAFQVYRYNGTAWVQTGDDLGFASGGAGISLNFDPSTNDPYVGFVNGAVNALQVYRYNGVAWAQTGADIGFSGSASSLSLKIHPVTFRPYISMSNNGVAQVYRYDGSSWLQIGSNIENSSGSTSLVVHPSTQELFLAYTNNLVNAFQVQQFTEVLPVKLSSFTARRDGSEVIINWQTAQEINSRSFSIERAIANNFETIGSRAAAGNSDQPRNYSFVDKTPAKGVAYYRLKQTDRDGNENYSAIVPVNGNPLINKVRVYPNPSGGVFTLSGVESGTVIEVFNYTGVKVKTTKADAGKTEINLSDQPGGNYIILIRDSSLNVLRTVFIKQ